MERGEILTSTVTRESHAQEGDSVLIERAVLKKFIECLLKEREDTAQENVILKVELEAYREKFAESLAISRKLTQELEALRRNTVPENERLKVELDVYKEKFQESLKMTKMVSRDLDSRNIDFQYYKMKFEDTTKELENAKKQLMSQATEIKKLQSQVAVSAETNIEAEQKVKEEHLKMDKEREEEIKKLTWVSIAVAQKLHKSEKVNASLKTHLKQEKEKVSNLKRELDLMKEAKENARKESKIKRQEIKMALDRITDFLNILRGELKGLRRRKMEEETTEIQEMNMEINKQNVHIKKLNEGNKRTK